jgi:hypothetical protein
MAETPEAEQGLCDIISGELPHPMQRICQKPAVLRYPAMGGGYMRLCADHGAKHAAYCERWSEVQGWLRHPISIA